MSLLYNTGDDTTDFYVFMFYVSNEQPQLTNTWVYIINNCGYDNILVTKVIAKILENL